MKIFWLSRHELSSAQTTAIRALHGDVVVERLDVVFDKVESLADFIQNHASDFVYAVATAPHYIYAALTGCRFGMFTNYPKKRQDGSFGLADVYHVDNGRLVKAWTNPDPNSDQGELLIPPVRGEIPHH